MTESGKKAERPIGVFDSGIGGLTVLKAIAELLPYEETIYLGDTARVPYGSKSAETVLKYSIEVSEFLLKFNIKLLVVACNTASAYALKSLKERLEVPVIGVVEPGARAAVNATKNGRIGVIGTEGTIKSSSYVEAIKGLKPDAEVFTKACNLFVPIAEEGLYESSVAELVTRLYLEELKDSGIDTLVLGCTHYPLLKGTIARFMGEGIRLIDSAESTAAEVKELLKMTGLLGKGTESAGTRRRFFVTDSPDRFVKVGGLFFGERLERAELVDVEG